MCKWPWRRTYTDQDGSNDLDSGWIGPVVAAFLCPNDSGRLNHAHGHAHGHIHYIPYRQMTMALHIYRPRWFHRIWFEVNRPSDCWVPPSAGFQKPLLQIPGGVIVPMGTPMWPQLANDSAVTHSEAEIVPVNLIWREWTQWLLGYWPYERTDGRRPFHSPSFFLRKGRGTKHTV